MKPTATLVAFLWGSIATAQVAQVGDVKGTLGVSEFTPRELVLPQTGWEPFRVRLPIGGRELDVTFTPRSIRGDGFRVLVQDEAGVLREVEPPPEATYWGVVEGEPQAVVAGSLVEGKLHGFVRLNSEAGGSWSIQPLSEVLPGAPAMAHIITRDIHAVAGPWKCGVSDRPRPFSVPRNSGGAATDAPLACQIACDADHEFYIANGSSVPNTTNDISSVINGMGAIYQSDANVAFVIGTVIVRQSPTQPYTSSVAGTLLDQFRAEWNTTQTGTQRDTAHLFTGKEIDGATIGLAYVGVICNSTFGYGFSQSRFTLNFANRVGVTSHEIGHNFNLDHCDGGAACSPCRIMCSGIGGCTGVVTSFGCSTSALISYAGTRACLTPLNNGLTPPFSDVFTTTTLDYTRWPNPTNVGAVVNTNGVSERSAPNSLNISNTSSLVSAGIDLGGLGSHRAFVSFWSQHRGVEAGETLVVAYKRTVQGDFLPLTTLTSTGVDQNTFTFTQVVLPTDGQGANAAIRFTGVGNQADDNWYIDDVKVSQYCRADLNEDWGLNILDFLVYQTALSTLNVQICDWNGDGFISVTDYSAFFNAVAAGCTGY
jgi:hypothetical protein